MNGSDAPVTEGGEWANLDTARARGENLWALELGTDKQPYRAHLIVSIDTPPWMPHFSTYHTACGQRFYSDAFVGCWSVPVGNLPLARGVCCTESGAGSGLEVRG